MHFIHVQILEPLLHWYKEILASWGGTAVILLMAMESSIIPLPSEVVIPPAAYHAWNDGGMSFFGVHLTGWSAQIGLVIAGALGSWLGATVMYWGARWAGR